MTQPKKLNGGSLYQRSSDGLWCARVEMPAGPDGKRRSKVVCRKDRAAAEAKLLEMNPNVRPAGFRSRAEAMREARALATHKPSEWHRKVRSLPNICRYCDTPLNGFNMVKDHMIAIEVGGSDGIDNVQPICWECNFTKGKTPHDEFVYNGPKPRPFSVMPVKRKEYERGQEMRRAMQGNAKEKP